jgi:hypothetical protein
MARVLGKPERPSAGDEGTMNDMNELDNYVRAVTRRLELDPTVHYEVAREVREHLEDAAEEARERGCSEEDCVCAALKAFGDADDLAEQLWQANRQRVRLRALAIWAGRLVLLPLVLVTAVSIGFTTLRSVNAAMATYVDMVGHPVLWWAYLGTQPRPLPKTGLSEEQLHLFGFLDEKLDHARILVKERPDDPLLHAHYVRLLSEQALGALGKKATEQQRQEWTEALARGKRLEPDNAMYNYLEAAFLVERGTEVQEDAGLPYRETGWATGEETKQRRGVSLTVNDPQALDAALAEVRDGLPKPHCTLHVGEVMALRASLERTHRTLADALQHIATRSNVLLPHLSPLRSLAVRLPGAAVWLAEQGRREDAVWLAGVMSRPGAQVAADANSVIEVLVGHAMAATADGQASALYELLGMPEQAAKARTEYERTELAGRGALRRRGDPELQPLLVQRAGVLLCTFAFAGTTPEGLRPMLGPYRTLEHVELERLGLAVLLVSLVLVAVAVAASAGWALLRYRSLDQSPKLLFIGWRSLAGVILLGVLVPALAYWVWTRWTPWSSLQYGINYVLARRIVEMGAAVAVIFCAVVALSLRSAARRCVEGGLPGAPIGIFSGLRHRVEVLASISAPAVVGGFVAIGAAANGAGWQGSTFAGLVFAALVLCVLFMARQARHAGRVHRPAWKWLGRTAALVGVAVSVALGGATVLVAMAPWTRVWPERVALVLTVGAAAIFTAAALVERPAREWLGRAAALIAVAVGAGAALSAAPALTRFLWREPLALALVFTVGAAATLIAVALVERAAAAPPDEQSARARRAVVRSALPVLAACIAVLSVGAGMWLNTVDARYARATEKTPLMQSEIGMTTFAGYQKEVQEAARRWTPPATLASDRSVPR